MKSGLAQSLSERSPKKGNYFQKAVSPLPKFASSWGHSLPACRSPHKLNSAALFLLLLPGHCPHQVRNHSHRTLGIAVHRPCLFRRHHHRCSLDRFSWVRLMGFHQHCCDYIRWCFADVAASSISLGSSFIVACDNALGTVAILGVQVREQEH
jgi:hypothetical protein